MSATVMAAAPATSARPAAATAVTLDRVTRRFDGHAVLNALDLAIPAGQFVAVVGRSGSGKSTLLRLLCGLDAPSSGRILFDGAAAPAGAARMMFQEPRLLPWARVVDNVVVGLPKGVARVARRAAAHEALRAVGLEARAGEWPAPLSGGQKQRVALARALVSRPGLLLLDEPLGALDALTRLDMQDLLADAWAARGMTAVLVTHDVAEAVRLADRILLIEDGTVTLDLANPAPRPRAARSAMTVDLEEHILARLMLR